MGSVVVLLLYQLDASWSTSQGTTWKMKERDAQRLGKFFRSFCCETPVQWFLASPLALSLGHRGSVSGADTTVLPCSSSSPIFCSSQLLLLPFEMLRTQGHNWWQHVGMAQVNDPSTGSTRLPNMRHENVVLVHSQHCLQGFLP